LKRRTSTEIIIIIIIITIIIIYVNGDGRLPNQVVRPSFEPLVLLA